MDQPAVSPSELRERAVSSEPCSTRPNPFDDDGSSARKRRRTSLNGASPSHSVETPTGSPHTNTRGESEDRDAAMTMDSAASEPRLSEHEADQQQSGSETRPTRITLNLKAAKQAVPSGPSSPTTPNEVDKDLIGSQEEGIRDSVEDGDADVPPTQCIDGATSTMDTDNPPVEVILDTDDEDQDGVPGITILQENNPMLEFPYLPTEPLSDSLPKLSLLSGAKLDEGWQEPASTPFVTYLHALLLSHPKSGSPSPLDSLYCIGFTLADLVTRFPRVLESLAGIAQLASFLARGELVGAQRSALTPDSDSSKPCLGQGYKLFDAISGALAACIDKSVNQIAPNTATELLAGLAEMLRLCLHGESEQAQDVIKKHMLEHPEIPPTETVKVIVNEWRLAMLTKLIMSSQMQLRIMAAQTMCADMVRIWKDYHEQAIDVAQQPVLRHFSSQLVRSQVVSYVLGPTCHPEVTAQSYNIIGFLFASHTFTEDQMDEMWRTVTTCQISGVSESLLMMMANIANLFGMDDFLCVFRKLQTVRIENFNATMKDFCDRVMSYLIEGNETIQDLLPYSLMFRLLRESSAPGPPFYRIIQKWASSLVLQLLRRGPSPEDRQLLIQECLKDITEKSRYTLGSLHGLLLLCRPGNRERDLQQLTEQYNLPQLLVDELEHAVSSRADVGVAHLISGQENAARLELLTSVILHGRDSDAVSEELGRKLWDLLVGPLAASQEDRDCAWQSLSAAMKSSSGRTFVETCFNDYFPTLSPDLFRPGSLDFILQRIIPLINSDSSFVLEDEESRNRLGIEQLWRIALTAPTDTIERRAIVALVKDVYLENRSIQQMPVHRVRKFHLALVDRCMQQLCSAAKHLMAEPEMGKNGEGGDAMITSHDDQSASEQEMLFTRSLTIVREFHNLHQLTPRFSSPDLRSLVLPQNNDVEGDSAELKFQSFDGDTQTDVRPLSIGRRNTAGSLLASIRDATGFDNYRLYYRGRPFTPSEGDICRSLEDLQIHNGLILVKRETDADEYPVHVRPGASPVEIEIMRHFEELWQYLALKEKLASELYAFLITLPVGDRIMNMVANEQTPYSDVFPIGHPLKSLYALHVIREHLSARRSLAKPSQENEEYDSALRRALALVVPALSDHEVIDEVSGENLRAALASRLVEQFLAILRDPMRPTSTTDFLDAALIERLAQILSSSLEVEPASFVDNLTNVAFRAIMDTCSLKWELWDLLQSKMDLQQTIQRLLVDDTRDIVRKSTAAIIGDKVVNDLGTSVVPATTFRDVFRPLLIDLVPRALAQPTRSLEVFNLLVIVFRSEKESAPPSIDIHKTVQRLNELLLAYSPSEKPIPAQGIPPGAIDFGAFGLVNLLHRLLCDNVDGDIASSLDASSGIDLFWGHLFPRRQPMPDLLWHHGLIYHETTRLRLNDIVLKLVGRNLSQLKHFFAELSHLVPCSTDDRADEKIYRYDLPFGFDRSKEIRAACGYAGLRNLSNTCYLNSLCTQLFMNFDFRKFILSVQVDRRDFSRSLLWETQSLFGQLQSSHQRFVDPESFVANIKTYDDDLINVHNQMDVEEFFNLLNDRLEGQLSSSEAVRTFRTFYGGQLVTQTKSKECDHISEVMEPFSAIQCDIKGKKNLLESLEAYVDGEHMEGDNKYKCSTCDRHVDAVRRSCLKEIPNSLIFHLKRFDFNLRTQSRSKINDYFAFPDRINMRPYTVQYLSNPSGELSEDWFELVGVLVHAGTAESGHYYSFIRERPTSRKDESWFEFNDDVVSPWHPSRMEACCFGGSESSWDAGGVAYEKNYCAYMLFYERSSTIERKQQELHQVGWTSPVQAKISTPLHSLIRDDNLRLLQRHCLFDPDHIRFVDSAIERMQDLNDGTCSREHETETLAMQIAIAHLDQVAARVRDVPEAQKLAQRIRGMVEACGTCALVMYGYLSSHTEAFRNLMQRNPEVIVRRSTAQIMMEALNSIKYTFPGNYCIGAPPTEEYPDDIVNGVCAMFEHLWEYFHYPSFHRSWPEVFDLMATFVYSGKDETLAFLTRGFLSKTMLIFMAEYLDDDKRDVQFTKMCNFLARRPNRSPCYASVIELLRGVLTQITPLNPVHGEVVREEAYLEHRDEPIRLTMLERKLLDQTLEVGGNALLDKVILLNQNVEATDAIVAHVVGQRWPIETDLLDTLIFNTTPQDHYITYGPYLRAAVVFCRVCYSPEYIDKLIDHVAKQSIILSRSEPKAVWKFFTETFTETRFHSGESRVQIYLQCLKYLPDWAPALLAQYDPVLSLQVETLLHDKVFQFGANSKISDAEGGTEAAEAIATCAKKFGMHLCEYISETCIKSSQTVSSQTVSLVSRVLSRCTPYFDTKDEAHAEETQKYRRNCGVVMDHLRRLSVDDLDDEGSDWENSFASSDQIESQPDEDMKDLDM
ncbi:hypothetical protein M406DRAFT_86920 [Cryphonectria parasitica EP155]|uniref:USP domain-containing protein n=1 Tax=Cryphonectria parasitica (strain ATCC 38755 / EP155) TaxID=660469 RepID=A0A9P5CT96_CRYP1|nr:uncharacterized protein M406DRAFT_86920 [Cryphonectria parasitica EP155]KAF3770103.1 hypothetical protein M406DRAFT_86920 [Cryphonectria parasitica EP155]